MIRAIAVSLALAGASLAAPRPAYDRAARAAHVKSALEAVRDMSSQALAQASEYIGAMERGPCSSGMERLKVECLVTAAQRWCRGRAKTCNLALDVVTSNVLAEHLLVSEDRRYEIMRRYTDYGPELVRETRRIQGALAADFRLAQGPAANDDALAAKIDAYCLATADTSRLSWQTCASELVWFIATSK